MDNKKKHHQNQKKKINFKTELCQIAYKYGTDKCPQVGHAYTPFYYKLLKNKRDSIKKVIEMGIGTPESMNFQPKRHYVTGASLYMWRDFFPKAQIYGADILPEAMFKAERIKTFLCDESKKEDLEKLIKKTGSDIDLFVDDGAHIKEYQIFLCKTIMPMLKKDVIYIIEDVGFPNTIKKALTEYSCVARTLRPIKGPCLPKNRVMVVRNN